MWNRLCDMPRQMEVVHNERRQLSPREDRLVSDRLHQPSLASYEVPRRLSMIRLRVQPVSSGRDSKSTIWLR